MLAYTCTEKRTVHSSRGGSTMLIVAPLALLLGQNTWPSQPLMLMRRPVPSSRKIQAWFTNVPCLPQCNRSASKRLAHAVHGSCSGECGEEITVPSRVRQLYIELLDPTNLASPCQYPSALGRGTAGSVLLPVYVRRYIEQGMEKSLRLACSKILAE